MGLKRYWLLLVSVALLTSPACSGDSAGSSSQTDMDAQLDADVEVISETSPETAVEISSDGLLLEVDSFTPLGSIPSELAAAGLVLPTDPPPEVELPEGLRLRVGTWNVYGGQWADDESLAATMKGMDLDLLGIEECPGDRIDAIAAAAGYEHLAYAEGKALLSRFPLAKVGTIALPPGGRGALRAEIERSGETFAVYVVHISWDVAGNQQARVLVDYLRQEEAERQVILVGDFNDERYSTQANILDEWLQDAATVFGWYPGQRISWPSHGFDDTEGSQLIDLVYFRRDLPAIVLDAEVVEMSPLGSDHKPAFASLLFPTRVSAPFDEDPFAALRDPFQSFPPSDARPPNLLVNPGAEEGLSGWDAFGGAETAGSREQQMPRSGAAFFTGYEKAPTTKTMRSGASQLVDLAAHAAEIDAGRGRVLASAYLCTGWLAVTEIIGDLIGDDIVTSNLASPYDDAEVLLEVLDAGGATIMHRSSGRRDTLGYHPWAEALSLPPGARAARLTWASNRKLQNGKGNDGVVDDLYLGFEALDAPHAAISANLLPDPGAELGLEGWETSGWSAGSNDTLVGPWGGTLFPPWSWSGERYFVAGAHGPDAIPPAGEAILSATVPLDEWRPLSDAGGLAVRWGGMARTYEAHARVAFSLTVVDGDGSDWGSLEAPTLFATGWTRVGARTKVPPGASALRFEVRVEAPSGEGAAFLDDLFVELEHLESGSAP